MSGASSMPIATCFAASPQRYRYFNTAAGMLLLAASHRYCCGIVLSLVLALLASIRPPVARCQQPLYSLPGLMYQVFRKPSTPSSLYASYDTISYRVYIYTITPVLILITLSL